MSTKFNFNITFFLLPFFLYAQPFDSTTLIVNKTNDFAITGDGSATNWNATDWVILTQQKNKEPHYETRFKILYSDSGIYCLYYCEDRKITATFEEDFSDLWHEDVIEAFFQPNESVPLYLEYELSPLNKELAILVPNFNGNFFGWRPWHYEGDRKTKHATYVEKNGEKTVSWYAEFFIPYALLKPLQNVPPGKGTKWRANFYRIDHDNGATDWSWKLVRTNFHDYERFGIILFE